MAARRPPTTAITPSSFTYTGSDQTERVQVDNTNFTYSGLGLETQSDSSGTTFYVCDTSEKRFSQQRED